MGIGAIGKLTVMFGADMKGFDRAMGKAEKRLNKWGRQMNRVGSSLTRNLTLPIVGLGAVAVKMASDYEESLNKVRVSFGDSTKDVENFAKTTLKSFGIAEGAALEMSALFGDMGTALGFTQSEAAGMSKTLVGLAGDLASFKNIQISEAQTALAGIFTGETESLKRLGIMTTEATLKNSDYFKSLNKTWKELTNAEKIQIRFNEVLRQSNTAIGDFERTSEGFANQMRVLQGELQETAEQLGKDLLPIAKELITVLRKGTSWLANLTKEQRESILQWGALAIALGPIITLFAHFSLLLANIAGAIKKIPALFTTLLSVFKKIKNVLGLVGTGGVVASFGALWVSLDKLGKGETTIERIGNAFRELAAGIKAYVTELLGLKKADLEHPELNLIDVEQLGKDMRSGKLINPLTGKPFATKSEKEKKQEEKKVTKGKIMTTIPMLPLQEIDEASRGWRTYYKEVEKVSTMWDESREKLAALNLEIRQGFEGALYKAMTAQENFFDSFISNLKRVIGQMLAYKAASAITTTLFGPKLGVGGAEGGTAGTTGGTILGNALGLLLGIPVFHSGGLVSGPTTALIGEGRGTSIANPEVVAPLNKLKSYMGGGNNIEVTGKLIGTDIYLSNNKTANQRIRTT